MSRALDNLRLVPGEEVLWVGRPTPDQRGGTGLDRRDAVALAVAAAMAAIGAITVAASPHDEAGLSIAVAGPLLVLVAWFFWEPPAWTDDVGDTDRYVVTTERVAVVKEAPYFWIVQNSAGVVPVVREVHGPRIVGCRRKGPNVLVREVGKSRWQALVLHSPDDPEGALRAVERMTKTPETEPA